MKKEVWDMPFLVSLVGMRATSLPSTYPMETLEVAGLAQVYLLTPDPTSIKVYDIVLGWRSPQWPPKGVEAMALYRYAANHPYSGGVVVMMIHPLRRILRIAGHFLVLHPLQPGDQLPKSSLVLLADSSTFLQVSDSLGAQPPIRGPGVYRLGPGVVKAVCGKSWRVAP